MRLKAVLLLLLWAQWFGVCLSAGQSPSVVGSWKVAITFFNGEKRSFRFEARKAGDGSFQLLDPASKVWGPAKASKGNWTDNKGSVAFTGRVEFPLGNVGRQAGTLLLNGAFEKDGMIAGTARFFSAGQDAKDPNAKPAKSGAFKATRTAGG
jgi:hypothetical protein